jgi:hypothetical protein
MIVNGPERPPSVRLGRRYEQELRTARIRGASAGPGKLGLDFSPITPMCRS